MHPHDLKNHKEGKIENKKCIPLFFESDEMMDLRDQEKKFLFEFG